MSKLKANFSEAPFSYTTVNVLADQLGALNYLENTCQQQKL
jgi:predicted secreted protein